MIRVFIVEDSEFLRGLMLAELSRQQDFSILGSTESAEEAINQINDNKPDVVVTDVYLPGKSGIELCQEIRKHQPDCKVVILTSSQSKQNLFNALEAGVSGFISKNSPGSRLMDAIRVAHEGHALIDPPFTVHLVEEFVQFRKTQTTELPALSEQPLKRLTVREIEILYLIGCGKSNAEIAKKLEVGDATVKTHVHKLLRKLSVDNRLQLAIFANEVGLKERL